MANPAPLIREKEKSDELAGSIRLGWRLVRIRADRLFLDEVLVNPSDQTTIGDVSMSVEAGMVAAMEQAEEIIRPIVDRAALSDSIRLYDLQVRIAKPLAEAADTIARLRAERDDARRIRDEHFREIERARSIIADLTAFRESVLTQRVSADWISVILSEDAHIENGQLENIPYLAVKIAEHVEATIARLRERVAELEGLCNDTEAQLMGVATELSSLKAAGTFADGIEAAAAAVQQAITELGPGLSQYDRGQFDGLRTARSRIRALSPAPEAKPVAAIEALRSHQIQLDQDGIQVGVSRQALEEVLSFAERKL